MTALEKIRPSPTRLGGTALYDWDHLVQEDRAHRLIYTDPAIFQAEMTHIFGGTWTYLAHESEIANVNDFITRRLGLRPLIIVRDPEAKVARSTIAARIAAPRCAGGTKATANSSSA